MKKKLFSIVLLCLFFIPTQLFAENVLFNISFRDDINKFRYQINDNGDSTWINFDINKNNLELVTSDLNTDNIYYQYSIDGKVWSDITRMSYNTETSQWENFSEVVIDTARVLSNEKDLKDYNSSELTKISIGGSYISPSANVSENMYDYGYGGNLRLNNSHKELDFYGEVSYWYGSSSNSLIDSIHTGLIGIGLGYKLNYGIISIIPELGAGLLVETLIHNTHGAIYCFDAYGETGLCISSKVNKNTQLFLRGNALVLSGTDAMVIETAITAGTSILL
jgi:hypothetical protein